MLVGLTLLTSNGELKAAPATQNLQLEVFLNERPTNLVAAFLMLPDKRIGASKKELQEIGLKPPEGGAPEDLVVLDELLGLSYRYDASNQQLFISAGDELRGTMSFDLLPKATQPVPIRSAYGGVVNYNLFASAGSLKRPFYNGASISLDARGFSPYGVLSQSAILRGTSDYDADAIRLDTTFTHADHESLTTYRAGDTISGGLAWTRPIRIGGAQMQRNFGLRPDLVTMPLPFFAGTAAVPSTVELYLNNLRTFSQEVPQGPYSLTNIPVISGAGTANIVIRDSAGHEVQKTMPFYTSAQLLRPGLTDFSVESGFARTGYGTSFDTYVDKPVVLATARRGIVDWLTLEAHGEAGLGLANGGAGVTAALGSFGLASLAVSASHRDAHTGAQLFGSYETNVFGININAAAHRTFGAYEDLASVTSLTPSAEKARSLLAGLLYIAPYELRPTLTGAGQPKALYRVSAGFPIPFDGSTVSASYIHLENELGRSDIVSGSWSRTFDRMGTFGVTAFADLADKRVRGLFFSWSVPFGETGSASAGLSTGESTVRSVDAMKPLEQAPGSYGWRVSGRDGAFAGGAAAGSYRSSYGKVEGAVAHHGTDSGATLEVDGAVATIGGGVFLANRVDDAFAVVETGVPGLDVFHENRPVGRTDSSGRAFIPGLRAHDKNKIAIDPRNAPLTAEINSVQDIVVPALRSGVRVDITVRTDTMSAIVVLSRPDGRPVPAGSRGEVLGGDSFVVGYDGRTFIKNLKAENQAAIEFEDGRCQATFSYAGREDEQVVISPVVCR
jgi:outer membrane usher protein